MSGSKNEEKVKSPKKSTQRFGRDGSGIFRKKHTRVISDSTFARQQPRRRSLGDEDDASTLPKTLLNSDVLASLVSESDADASDSDFVECYSDFVESYSDFYGTVSGFLEDCMYLLCMLGEVPNYSSQHNIMYQLDSYVDLIKSTESTFVMREFKPLLDIIESHRQQLDPVSQIKNSQRLGLLLRVIGQTAEELRSPDSVHLSSGFSDPGPFDQNVHETFRSTIIPRGGVSRSYLSNELITVSDHVGCSDVEFLSGINAYRLPGLSEDVFRDSYEGFRNLFLKQIEKMNPLLLDNDDTANTPFDDLESYVCYFLIKSMPLVLRLYNRAIDIADIAKELVMAINNTVLLHPEKGEVQAINSKRSKVYSTDLVTKIDEFFSHHQSYQYLLTSARHQRRQPAYEGMTDQLEKKYETLQLALVMSTQRVETSRWPKEVSLIIERTVDPDDLKSESKKIDQLLQVHKSLNGLLHIFREANKVFDRLTSALRDKITFDVCLSESVQFDVEVDLSVVCMGRSANIRIVNAFGESELSRDQELYRLKIPAGQKSVSLLVRVTGELLATFGEHPIMVQIDGVKKKNKKTGSKAAAGKSLIKDNNRQVLCLTLLNANSVGVVAGGTSGTAKSSKLMVSLSGMEDVYQEKLDGYLETQAANLHCRFFGMKNIPGNNYGRKSPRLGRTRNASGSVDNSVLSPRRVVTSKPGTPRDEDERSSLRGRVSMRKSEGPPLNASLQGVVLSFSESRPRSGSFSDNGPSSSYLQRKSGAYPSPITSPTGSPRDDLTSSRRAFTNPGGDQGVSTPASSQKVQRPPPVLRKMKSALKFERPEQPRDGADPADDKRDDGLDSMYG